jgi:hypothetical protein
VDQRISPAPSARCVRDLRYTQACHVKQPELVVGARRREKSAASSAAEFELVTRRMLMRS